MGIKNVIGWLFMVAALAAVIGGAYERALLWLILAELLFIHADIK